jgi:hypothetical protein
MVVDEGGAIAGNHLQSLVIRRQHEVGARGGNHFRVDFQRGQPALRQIAVDVLGDGPAAQADQRNIARVAAKQRKRHHRAGIFQFQRIRFLEPHRALHGRAAEMQVADIIALGDFDRRMAGTAAAKKAHGIS